MEALVNIAYDRISEDIILLYDAMCAYNEAPAPRPHMSVVMHAISCSLTKDSEKAMGLGSGHTWDQTRAGAVDVREGGSEVDDSVSHAHSNWEGNDDDAYYDNEMVPMGKEPQLWEFARDVVTSVVSDLAVIPFWAVKLSAVAHRGRLPELWPFVGYRKAITGIFKAEGLAGLFKGWGPVCAAGLLRSKLLYTDYYWKTTHRVTTRFIMRSDSYSRHVNDPEVLAQTYEGVVTRILWASILHPFDLVATRMITESSPEYNTMTSSLRHIFEHRGVAGLFLGVRSSILNVLLPFGNWYLMGVPFLIKTRRTLDGMDTVFRAGMGGSLDMVRAILKKEGFAGLFAGYRATLWGVGPAFLSLCGARLMVYMLMGSSRRTTTHRGRRNAHLRHLMNVQREAHVRKGRQEGSENAAGGTTNNSSSVDVARVAVGQAAGGDGSRAPLGSLVLRQPSTLKGTWSETSDAERL